MTARDERRRLFTRLLLVLGGGAVGGFALLAGRLYQLQVLNHDRYALLSDRNRIRVEPLTPRRGRLLAADGAVLADGRSRFVARLDDDDAADADQRRRIAALLGGKFVSPSVAALAVALLAACATPPEEGAGARGASAGGAGMVDASIGNSGAPVAGSEQDFRQTAGDRVFFATDTDALSAEAQATLRRQAAWLTRYPQVDVLIEGHADERGTRDYNLALGERRATSVKGHLVALGIASTRIQTVSYGKERPTCVAGTPACWQENRRAVTVLR